MRQALGPGPSGVTDEVTKQYVDLANAASLHPQGAWSGTAGYKINDLVNYGGTSYACTSVVTAPSTTSYVDKVTSYSASNGTVNVPLPSTVQVGDMAIIATIVDAGTIYTTAPVSGSTRLGTVIPGNNAGFGFLHYYTVSSTDITNGFLVVGQINTTSTAWITDIQFYRSVTVAPGTGTNPASGWYTTNLTSSVSTHPTVYSDFIPTFTGSLLTSISNTITNSGLTDMVYAAVQSSGTHILGIGGGYSTVASGTQAATTFVYSARNTSGGGVTLECFVPITTATSNPTPDVDGSHWTPLVIELPGVIKMYGASTAPTGYLNCDGSAVSRTTYAALFAIIGTTYGVGDGSSTFNLPNLTNQFPRGQTPGLGGGSDTHTHADTLTAPTHTHSSGHNHTLSTNAWAQFVAGGTSVVAKIISGVTSWTSTARVVGTSNATQLAETFGTSLDGVTDSTVVTTGGPSATALTGSVTAATAVPAYTGVAFIIKT